MIKKSRQQLSGFYQIYSIIYQHLFTSTIRTIVKRTSFRWEEFIHREADTLEQVARRVVGRTDTFLLRYTEIISRN